MNRWFFADDELICRNLTPKHSSQETPRKASPSVSDTEWIFKVKFDWKICSNETLAICGSCPILGKWDIQHSLPLIRDTNSSYWTLKVTLPREFDIRYRYLVYGANASGERIVRFWETNHGARLISRDQKQDIKFVECETFGLFNNRRKIERGWINSYVTMVQFKFFKAPFLLKSSRVNKLLNVKITPMAIKAKEKCEKEQTLKSKIINDNDIYKTFAYCEVATWQKQEFHKQPKYGTPCESDHLLIFNLTLGDMKNTAYLIDLYNYSLKSGIDIPPHHFGYQYVLPSEIKGSEGTLQLTIMCGTKHRPIGSMKCDYVVVKPIHSHSFNLEKTFQRHWNTNNEGIYIGHRGCGKSFWFKNNIVRENTINSLNLAIEHGAEMVEFDVQLTRDMVPILYHDFQLYTTKMLNIDPKEYDIMNLPLTKSEIKSLKLSIRNNEKDLLKLPLSRLTLEQLQRITAYVPTRFNDPDTTCDSDIRNNRAFITLEQILEQVDPKIGFVIDIKWPQKLKDGTMQESFIPDVDKNVFVDAILHVVLQKADSRRIVFTSFDANICSMVRLKQNLYPILFMIAKSSNKDKYHDQCGASILNGTYFANAMELLGIVVNCADILEMPGKVSDTHEKDLCIFSWGKQGRSEDLRKYLKALDIDGIIVDRINHALEPKDLQKKMFFVDLLE